MVWYSVSGHPRANHLLVAVGVDWLRDLGGSVRIRIARSRLCFELALSGPLALVSHSSTVSSRCNALGLPLFWEVSLYICALCEVAPLFKHVRLAWWTQLNLPFCSEGHIRVCALDHKCRIPGGFVLVVSLCVCKAAGLSACVCSLQLQPTRDLRCWVPGMGRVHARVSTPFCV
jgi:hypothetical protein